MRIANIIILCFLVTGCTLSFNLIDTHGEAADMVDETQSNEPNISPEISVPVSAV